MTDRRMRHWKLSTRILVIQVAVLVLTLSVGVALWVRVVRSDLDKQYEQRALTVAVLAANDRAIQSAMAAGDPNGTVATMAERLRRLAGASYVVVLDRTGVRHSHPRRDLIGRRIEEPLVALDGRDHLGVDPGNLGPSANARVPLYSPDGRLIGEVSAGILESRVSAALGSSLPTLVLYSAVALLIGTIASLLLARRLKQQTFGLEPHELASLLQEREAMLHGVREGVITVDPDGRVSLINEEARRLFHITGNALRQPLRDVLPEGRVRALLTEDPAHITDETVLTNEFALVISQMPVRLRDRSLGTVITARDRTETIGLLRELDSVKGLTDALRAQQHEHANRMHIIAGLLELGRYEDATSYLREVSDQAVNMVERLQETIGEPAVVALLVAKATIASEHGVVLHVDSDVPNGSGPILGEGTGFDARTVITVLGNLIDNAIDAVAGVVPSAEVSVQLQSDDAHGDLVIVVRDNGPGVPDTTAVFQDGFSTKNVIQDNFSKKDTPAARGLGLSLVRRLVSRSGGSVAVTNDGGAVFRVVLPPRAPVPTSRLNL